MTVRSLVERLRGLVEAARGETTYKEYKLHAYSREHQNEWGVEAYTGNWQKVGDAEFVGVYDYDQDDNPLVALKGWNVEVRPDHRRKGLASAMYKFAEKTFKLKILPGDFQTSDGKSFVGRK